ncbi:alpha-L-rhamnosidase [bacterium]|nr:MAG: alpha-L-rhamnosidase [bacterium]
MFTSFSCPVFCRLVSLPLLLVPALSACAQQTPTLSTARAAAPDVTKAVDVTKQVMAQVQDNSLDIVAETALAGADPARKIVKKLVVIYSIDTQQKVAAATEGDTLRLVAPAGKTLSINKALYGDISAPVVDVATLLTTNFPLSPVDIKVSLPRPELQITPIQPVKFEKRGSTSFVDFGADAYGNLQITLPKDAPVNQFTIRLGEKLDATGAIDRKPPGSVNCRELTLATQPDKSVYQLQIPSKPRHKDAKAVRTPPKIGEITVFRYAEIDNAPAAFDAKSVRQLTVHTAFDDSASSFQSSDKTLDAVWNLCKHTMKATTAFGVYIDGERERIPYEADAYINQLSHLACDANPEVARATIEHLLAHPTWPTEWSFHMPMMAAADYEMTGDIALSDHNYEALKKKLLMDKAREDGLLRALAIVDWPSAERDGYNQIEGVNNPGAQQQIGPEINTVVNAFYYHSLLKMASIARVTKREGDAHLFETKAKQVYSAFNKIFFDPTRGIYIDGEGSKHASLHANMFALAFDLVPQQHQKTVADFVQSRGMACSVYGAQYLLEALYKADKANYALQLMTSHSDRGWWHMIDLGSTMTLEAWDLKYKNNLTWNHAWGAAPANIISRYLLGVRPLQAGYKKILIAPQPGTLEWVRGKVPTAQGPVVVNYRNGVRPRFEIEVPTGASARILIPTSSTGATKPLPLWFDGQKTEGVVENHAFVIDGVGPGKHIFEFSDSKPK